MVFYETMQKRVASILAELDVRAGLALEVRCGCVQADTFSVRLL